MTKTFKTKNLLLVIVTVLLVGLFTPAIGANEPKYGGTFYYALDRDVGSIDPHSAHSVQRINVGIMMFDQLTTFDENGNVIPNLATSWDISADGKSYTFHLRKGVKFHNGREFTAADVKYSFERLSNPKTKALGYALLNSVAGKEEFADGKVDHISGIKIIDDYTVQIDLVDVDVTFIRKLATTYSSIVAYEGVNAEMEMVSPIGTGPFVFVEYVPNQHLKMDRNPNFWQTGKPYLDNVVVHMNVDPSVQLMRYQTDQLHYMGLSSPVAKHTLEADPRYRSHIKFLPGPTVQVLTLNANIEPFSKKEVRQAINWAINRERIASNVIGGLGVPAQTPLPSAMSLRLDLKEWYGYDPAKAKELLAQAGYPDGFSTELVVVANEVQKLASEGVQADLAKVGIDVQVRVVEPATYTAMMNEGKVPFGNMNVGSQMADPDEVFFDFLHSSRTPGLNRAAYKNPELDALIEKARATVDEDARNAIYVQAAELVMEEAPWAPIYFPYTVIAVKPELKGLELMPTRPGLRITGAWFDK
ncbi:MAG: ABC transporter substrate-binding protein [Firmicutes bacterium]|nr:ABC transporter substrate-binding protein [Bacillota bacterium]